MARISSEQWGERVDAWAASGQTAAEFGSSRRIDARQLQWWKWKLARDGRAEPRARPTFVPAHVVAERPSMLRAGIDVTFPSGVVVRVPAGFSRSALAELIEAVGALAC
jgi:hypothetical protein